MESLSERLVTSKLKPSNMAETWQVLRSVVKFCESKRGGHLIQWPIRDIKTQLFILGNLNGKTSFQVWGFIFIPIIFSFVKTH